MSKGKKLVVKPCPCCKNKDLYLGAESCDAQMVCCHRADGGCGLRMVVRIPDTMGQYTTLVALEASTLRKAVRLWNRRNGKC